MKQLYVNNHAVYSHAAFRCTKCHELVIAPADRSDGVRCPLCGVNVVPIGNAVMASTGSNGKAADIAVGIAIEGMGDVAAARRAVDDLARATKRATKTAKRLRAELKQLGIPPVEKNGN